MKALNVFSGQALVGQLTESEAQGLCFQYVRTWLADKAAKSLSPELPLDEQIFSGDTVASFFQNLLPEGEILQFISRAAHISGDNTFGLLERFGGDTAGAFSVLPEGVLPSATAHYLAVSQGEIGQWLEHSRGIPLNINGEQARMSLSGAQDKITVFINAQGEMAIPLGAAPSSHIIKPSIKHRHDVPNTAMNEFMIMTLAREMKLDVAEVNYLSELNAVIVTRFDRKTDAKGQLTRLHQNDLCQLLGLLSNKKYESEGGPTLKACFNAVLKHSSQPAKDKKRLIEWVVFNVLVGNMDGHAKNLSLMRGDDKTKLTPFYDLICTAVYPQLSQKLAFKIGGENRPQWLMRRHWERFAQEIDTKPTLVISIINGLSKRMEQVLPVLVNKLNALHTQTEERAMVEKITQFIEQSTVLLTSRINDDSAKQ